MHFYDYNTVLQVSKQASTAYGVCEVWKHKLSTLIAIISRSASSWFSANYTIDQAGRFLFGKFQEEACYWLRPYAQDVGFLELEYMTLLK